MAKNQYRSYRAGWRKGMANSTVAVTDMQGRPARHAARGGLGAVMGAKGLKAILIDGSDSKFRIPKNPTAFKNAVKNAVKTINSMQIGKDLRAHGSAIWVNLCDASGQMPTLNHSHGAWVKKMP